MDEIIKQFLVFLGISKKNNVREDMAALIAQDRPEEISSETLSDEPKYKDPYHLNRYYYLMVFIPLLLGFTAVLLPLLGVIGSAAAIISLSVGVATVAAATVGHFFYLYNRSSNKFDEVTLGRHLLAAGVIGASIVLLALIGVAPVAMGLPLVGFMFAAVAGIFATTAFAGVSVGVVLSVAAAATIILTVLGHGRHIDTQREVFAPKRAEESQSHDKDERSLAQGEADFHLLYREGLETNYVQYTSAMNNNMLGSNLSVDSQPSQSSGSPIADPPSSSSQLESPPLILSQRKPQTLAQPAHRDDTQSGLSGGVVFASRT